MSDNKKIIRKDIVQEKKSDLAPAIAKPSVNTIDELDIILSDELNRKNQKNEDFFRLDFDDYEESQHEINQKEILEKIEERKRLDRLANSDKTQFNRSLLATDSISIDYRNIIKSLKSEDTESQKQILGSYKPENISLTDIGNPENLVTTLADVGYQCNPFLAAQICLSLNTKSDSVRGVLLEGPSGCGKSFMAKCLAKVTGSELLTLSCFPGMNIQSLIESPSNFALAKAMAGNATDEKELMNLGVISRAFEISQTKPVILLIDELDKVDQGVDTFFLGPLQDGVIWLESQDPIEANINNILVLFTKNYDRNLNDALLRRLQPISMTYLDSKLERKILSKHCLPQLIENLVTIADIMRYSDGSYTFDRPPAPEELLKTGRYVMQLLEWDIVDFEFVGRNVWYMIAKSENDRFVLELLLRYHPDFYDSLNPSGRKLTLHEVYKKLGQVILKGIVADPKAVERKAAYKVEQVGLTSIGEPKDILKKLSDVGYQCPDFLATQMSLVLNTPSEKVRAVLLEGPPGCGKSYLAKCLAKVTGSELMCLSCYSGMNIQHLIERPSAFAVAGLGTEKGSKDDILNLGILSKAYLKSKNQPVILLIDEIDKVEVGIDTFFLGPLQDATIYLESRPAIDANVDNLLIIFTKNYERVLNDALLRRLHPIEMSYLDSSLEAKILSKYCTPTLITNIMQIVDRMRHSGGTYGFDRPPAPEELLTIGHYINQMLDWGEGSFSEIGKNIWSMLAKSEHDRKVLDYMMRFHPDFMDPLYPDGKNMSMEQVFEKIGAIILKDIIEDPKERLRKAAWDKYRDN